MKLTLSFLFNNIEQNKLFLFNNNEKNYMCMCVIEFMLSEDTLKEILLRQRDTMLKKDYGVERDLLKNIEKKLLCLT